MMNGSAKIFSRGPVGFEEALLGLDQATEGKVIEGTSGKSFTISLRKIPADPFINEDPCSDEKESIVHALHRHTSLTQRHQTLKAATIDIG